MTKLPQPSNPDHFPPGEFDAWAENYDESTRDNGYPFTGYAQVLETIFRLAQARPGDLVMDLGTGTGNLAEPFVMMGCQVWGLDFSGEMLAQARAKLPQAVFGQVDIRSEWPPDFRRRYHCIVSGYTFHHFPLTEKVRLIQGLCAEYLLPGGRVVIGDIAFDNAPDEEQIRRSLGDEWEQEYYWLADESLEALRAAGLRAEFQKVSSCAGVFRIKWGHVDLV